MRVLFFALLSLLIVSAVSTSEDEAQFNSVDSIVIEIPQDEFIASDQAARRNEKGKLHPPAKAEDAPEPHPCDDIPSLDDELLPWLKSVRGESYECQSLKVQQQHEILFIIEGNDGKTIRVARSPKTVAEIPLSDDYAEGNEGKVLLNDDIVNLPDGVLTAPIDDDEVKREHDVAGSPFTISFETSTVPSFSLVQQKDKQYAMGYIRPSQELLDSIPEWTPTEEMIQAIPTDWDFVKKYPQAVAGTIRDQGGCGSCWAFAGTKVQSMNLYHQTQGKWNVEISQQDATSCYKSGGFYMSGGVRVVGAAGTWQQADGCNGGNGLTLAIQSAEDGGRTERRCDPYTGKGFHTDKCGSYTSNTCNKFATKKGEMYKITKGDHPTQYDAYELSNANIKAAIMEFGSIDYAQDVTSSFTSHSGGHIYGGKWMRTNMPDAWDKAKNKRVGAHAMAIVGWGVDDGEEYWIIHNSWGTGWGDRGTVRLAMSDVPDWGYAAPEFQTYRMATPDFCAVTSCQNGGTPQKDCSCHCPNSWSGSDCGTCSASCPAGVEVDPVACTCKCPADSWGKACEYYVRVQLEPAEENGKYYPRKAASKIKVEWSLEHFYNDETNPAKNAIQAIVRGLPAAGVPRIGGAFFAFIKSKKGSYSGQFATLPPVGQWFSMAPFGPTGPRAEACGILDLWLGKNEFGGDRGSTTRPIPCIKVPWSDEAVTGEDGKCLCGGTTPAPGSLQDKLQCPESVYEKNCCPATDDTCQNSGLCRRQQCLGRTGRKEVGAGPDEAAQKAEEEAAAAKKAEEEAAAKKAAEEAAAKKAQEEAAAAKKAGEEATAKKAEEEAAAAKKAEEEAATKKAEEEAAAKKAEEEAAAAKKATEEARKKAEEEARKKAAEAAAARRKAAEEAKKKAEEEAAAKKKAEEEAAAAAAAAKKAEEAAAAAKKAEEEAATKKAEEEAAAKKAEEEAAAAKKAEEEAAAKKAEEEAAAAKKAEEEAAAKKAEEEAAAKKAEEEAAAAKKAAEEAEAARKKAEEEAAAKKKAEEEAEKAAKEMGCVDKHWMNGHGHTCVDIAHDQWAQGDWTDTSGVRADEACCDFGGGNYGDGDGGFHSDGNGDGDGNGGFGDGFGGGGMHSCVDKHWMNGHGHTCVDIAHDQWAQGDWTDTSGVRADEACCDFGGGTWA